MFPIHNNGIQYQLLDQSTAASTEQLIVDIFVHDEYLTRESGITEDEFAVLAKAYCDYNLKKPLSIVALDEATQEVIGFIIAEDLYGEDTINPSTFFTVSEHFKPFVDILEQMHERFLTIEQIAGECYHSFLWGVRRDYRRRGIIHTMNLISEDWAKECGFNQIMVEATSPPTKPACEKLGYTMLGNIPYASYEFNGSRPYQHITDYDGPYLFLKIL